MIKVSEEKVASRLKEVGEYNQQMMYEVFDKRIDRAFNCLGFSIEEYLWFWCNKDSYLENKHVRLKHTRQQLIEAGFEEIFTNKHYELKKT